MSEPDHRPGDALPPRRPDASMSLLRELLANPLDADYRVAAHRGAPGGLPPRRYPWWQRVLVVLVCTMLGAGAVWAAKELRAPVGDELQARALLEQQITERTAEGESLREANAAAASEVAELRAEALGGTDQSFLTYLRELGMATGAVEVRGPGLVIELDDSPAAQDSRPGSDEGRVQDVDLQVIVNGLWASGAEAIAVNGHRLTATSAIRSAGQAILVDLAPVLRPYTVEVIGDAAELEVGLARTNVGGHITALRETYDITVDLTQVEELVLPGAPTRTLRFAAPVGVTDSGEDVALPSRGVPGSTRTAPTPGVQGEVS